MKNDKQKKYLDEKSRYIFFGRCHFSAGIVKNTTKAKVPYVDKIYLEMEKPSEGLHRIFLMPLEALAISASLTDAVFKLESHRGWVKFRRKNRKK